MYAILISDNGCLEFAVTDCGKSVMSLKQAKREIKKWKGPILSEYKPRIVEIKEFKFEE